MSDHGPGWRPLTLALLAALAFLFGAALLLLIQAEGALGDRLDAFDAWFLAAAAPAGPPVLTEVIRDLTALGSLTFAALVVVSVAAYLLASGRIHDAAFLVATVLIGVALAFVVKDWVARPRPDAPPGAPHVASPSFPSAHAGTAAVVFLTCAAVVAPLLRSPLARAYTVALAILLTLAIGASRVYLGVHYPSDVVGGWLLGGGWVALALAANRTLVHQGLLEPRAASRVHASRDA